MPLHNAVVLGLLLGIRHAADPDHVVVLTTLIERERSFGRVIRTAGLWGLGHSATFLAVALAIVVLGVTVPPSFERGTQLAVAVMLVGVGVLHIVRQRAQRALCPRANRPEQDPPGHHLRRDEPASPPPHGRHRASPRRATLRPVFVGLVHGLAGSASIALVALSTIRSTWGAMIYLLLFCAGTGLGMAVVTAAIYVPITRLAAVARTRRVVSIVAGSASVVFGLVIFAGALMADVG